MSFSHLEKTLLLSLKEQAKEARLRQNVQKPAPGPHQLLWRALGKFYGKYDKYRHGSPALVKEEILDRIGCTDEELSVTLYLLSREKLVDYSYDHDLYTITESGLQACRKFSLDI